MAKVPTVQSEKVKSKVTSTLVSGPAITSFEPLLTKHQVADILQVKPSTVYELTRRRHIPRFPFLKVGKYLRFRRSEIETWLDEGQGRKAGAA